MLIILVGMIASGKGTFSKRLAKRGAITCNDDSIVAACHGGDYTLYRKENKTIYKNIETTMVLGAMVERRDVVVDRPNFKAATRARYIEMARVCDTPIICVKFPRETAEVHAKRRFESDPRGLPYEHWLQAALRHQAEWQEPKMDEGFDNMFPVDVAYQMLAEGTF
jgi:predicted kinase